VIAYVALGQKSLYTPERNTICSRLQILLTMPNLPFRDRHGLSTGLQLQQKDQNHTAISHCGQARNQLGRMAQSSPKFWTANFEP